MDQIDIDNLSLVLILGMGGMFALAGAIIMFVMIYKRKIIEEQLFHQQNLVQTAVDIQEEERKRFAADLHDEIGGGISTILLSLSVLEQNMDPIQVQKVKNIRAQLDSLLQAIREISYNIAPYALENYGLMATLNDLCFQIQESGGISVDFSSEGEERRLDFPKELAIYRICTELFSNSIKHAEATRISICMHYTGTEFKIVYGDNGKGFLIDEPFKGSGMKNMMNRSKILGADFEIESKSLQGMTAYLVLKRAYE